jgi:hypothetical protein
MKDLGDCWFDDEMTPRITYREDGSMESWIYCPTIPKIIAKNEKDRLEMDALCTPPITIIKKFLDSQE